MPQLICSLNLSGLNLHPLSLIIPFCSTRALIYETATLARKKKHRGDIPREIKVQGDNDDAPSVNTCSSACHLAEHSLELHFGVIYVNLLGQELHSLPRV